MPAEQAIGAMRRLAMAGAIGVVALIALLLPLSAAAQSSASSSRPLAATQAQCAALPQLDKLLSDITACRAAGRGTGNSLIPSCMSWWRNWPTSCSAPASCAGLVDRYYATLIGVGLRNRDAVPGTARAEAVNGSIRNACAPPAPPKPPPSVAAPTMTPGSGAYAGGQSVRLATTTPGATIRYTTNGVDPTAAASLYTVPIAIGGGTTLKARAFKSGMTDSRVTTATYSLLSAVATPTATPSSSSYPTCVSLATATPGATIRYGTDARGATASLVNIYSKPISVAVTMPIGARASKRGLQDSATATFFYQMVPPAFSVSPGSPSNKTEVMLIYFELSPVGYGHQFLYLRDTVSGESVVFRAGPSGDYPITGVISDSPAKNPAGESIIIWADREPAAVSDDAMRGQTVRCDALTSRLGIADAKRKLDEFNTLFNAAKIDYRPRSTNSNAYASTAFRVLTGKTPPPAPRTRVMSVLPGAEIDLRPRIPGCKTEPTKCGY